MSDAHRFDPDRGRCHSCADLFGREETDMNHQHDEEQANGHQVNGEQPTEEELDAYEERLTNEAIVDQVKVTILI